RDAAEPAERGACRLANTSAALAPGVDGWRDDDLAFVAPWGFDVADIGVPALLLQGTEHLMLRPQHGRWLAGHIPGVEAEISETEGHLTLLARRVQDVHAWLLQH